MLALFRPLTSFAMLLLLCGLAAAEPLKLGVATAMVMPDPSQAALDLKLTPDSAKAFAAFTSANVGKTIDLSTDGAVVMSPRLVEPILGGEIMVSGTFAKGELERLARRISSGDARVAVEAKAD